VENQEKQQFLIATGQFIDNLLDILARNIQRLLTICLFVAVISHILHFVGVPVADLLGWVAILSGSPGH
jgi:hypothetical protein